MARILIDTRIWSLALKNPFISEESQGKDLYVQAAKFVDEAINREEILLSSQLIAEIYHVLRFRGKKVDKEKALELTLDILDDEKVDFRNVEEEHIREALRLSTITGIHIWDFLVVLPFRGEIDTIYAMDPHFRDCKNLQLAPIENSLGIWKVEGER